MPQDTLAARQEHDHQVPAGPPYQRNLPVVQRLLKGWAQLAVAVSYRQVDVVRTAGSASDGPAILAVNHTNALGDPVMILAKAPGFPRFVAAATWWKFAPARWLFGLAGVLPVHRRRDGDTQQNSSSFDACHDALARGARISIHPEGEMHQGPALLPIRTGAARIALSAVVDGGVHDLTIVPYALVYADRARFRSRAAVNVGVPIPVLAWSDRYRADPEAAVRDLTDVIAQGMAAVATTYGSVDGVRVVDRAAALAVADAPDPADRTFGRQHALARALGSAVLSAGGESSARFRELEAAIAAHDDDLRALGVARQGSSPRLASPRREARRRNALGLAALTPAAATGLVTNLPVALAIAGAGRLVRGEGWKATVNGVLGSALLPIAWTLETVWACRRVGRRRGIAVAVIGPIGGWALLAWNARWARWRHESWRDAMETKRPDAFAAARTSRAAVKTLVEGLLEHPTTPITRPAVLVATPLQLSELSV